MKTKFYQPAIIILCMGIFTSCKKDDRDRSIFGNTTPTNITLTSAIKTGENYTLNLTPYGNGIATITRQATSYIVSQISQDAGGNNVYCYTTSLSSKTGEIVADQAVLKITSPYENRNGCNNHHEGSSEKYITINFTVE